MQISRLFAGRICAPVHVARGGYWGETVCGTEGETITDGSTGQTQDGWPSVDVLRVSVGTGAVCGAGDSNPTSWMSPWCGSQVSVGSDYANDWGSGPRLTAVAPSI